MKTSSVTLTALMCMAMAMGACSTTSSTHHVTTSTGSVPGETENAATPSAVPAGSGRGLCLDRNSVLAQTGMAQLKAPPRGTWSVSGTSEHPLADGCDGVLSWMAVSTDINHPHTHLLLFANGTYLGTATDDPYTNTQVIDLGRNAVAVKYHWLQADDPMCCPTGGPKVVTFTLNGTTVQTEGQLPPYN